MNKKYSASTVNLMLAVVAVVTIFAYAAINELILLGNYKKGVIALILLLTAFLSYRMGMQMARSLHFDEMSPQVTQNLDSPAVANDPDAWEGFDVDSDKYPEELDIAMQAWRAVCTNPGAGSVKEQLSTWLKTTYPDQSGAAVERIVGVCNWDKGGGRPKGIQ